MPRLLLLLFCLLFASRTSFARPASTETSNDGARRLSGHHAVSNQAFHSAKALSSEGPGRFLLVWDREAVDVSSNRRGMERARTLEAISQMLYLACSIILVMYFFDCYGGER